MTFSRKKEKITILRELWNSYEIKKEKSALKSLKFSIHLYNSLRNISLSNTSK